MQNPLALYCPRAYPLPILSHPMHALPLFHPTPCMPSPYSIPPHACPPPIPSHPMHALPLFYPTPSMPSPYSIPPEHFLPLLYPTPCIPSPNSSPAYAHPLPILSQPTHATPVFYSILFQPKHALLTPCYIHLEGMFFLWHMHMPLLNLLTLSMSSSFTLFGNL